jgi:aminoglycoside/choline kinase family phosphotransferase
MNRLAALERWACEQLGVVPASIVPASEDASFRRYFRVTFDGRTAIVMDAPPEHEDCAPFVHVAQVFSAAGVNVPAILAKDLSQGFLLLSDFGSTTYREAIDSQAAGALYHDALDALVRVQAASRDGVLPHYDHALLRREIDLFPTWYVSKHLGVTLTAPQTERLNAGFERILARNLAEPRVYVHRDYHSRNLMLTDPNPGILDFQDAVYGPISYDLVSLLKDAYVEWPEPQVLDWCVRYWEKARTAGLPVHADFGDFYTDFEWMGVQRHLKVLGIFARLWHRDGKSRYLADLPLVLRYLERTLARYRDLEPLARLLDEIHERAPRQAQSF